MTIHSRLSFSRAPVTVFVFAIFCFVFFWQRRIIGDTLCLKRNSPAQQCGLFVHQIWRARESNEGEKKNKKKKQQHVTTVIINTERRENKPKDGPEVRKGRRFYRLVSWRAGGLHRCTWRGSPPYSPRTAHPASPWSWTLESCFPIFQRTLPQSLCPLLSLFSVKHIYGMTSQVYPSCEPSAPFFGSG